MLLSVRHNESVNPHGGESGGPAPGRGHTFYRPEPRPHGAVFYGPKEMLRHCRGQFSQAAGDHYPAQAHHIAGPGIVPPPQTRQPATKPARGVGLG